MRQTSGAFLGLPWRDVYRSAMRMASLVVDTSVSGLMWEAPARFHHRWVLKGEPALVGSTSPRRGGKVSYYSAVCLETGEVAVWELEGNSNFATSAAFLQQLRAQHPEPLIVILDNAPAHRGNALRAST